MSGSSRTSATILQFPCANRFTPAEIAQVNRWAAEAEPKGWFLRDAKPPSSSGTTWIGQMSAGYAYFTVAYGHRGNGPYYFVIRRHGRWLLCNARGEPMGEFRGLQSALDVICPPPSGAA